MTYEVQQYTFCEGWVNTWQLHHEDGTIEPETFATYQEAQAALDEFFAEIADEIAAGQRPADNGYACSRRWWAGFPRDDGQAFRVIVGTDSSRSWAGQTGSLTLGVLSRNGEDPNANETIADAPYTRCLETEADQRDERPRDCRVVEPVEGQREQLRDPGATGRVGMAPTGGSR